MRWVYLLIIIVFALATLIFAVQNLDTVTVSFLNMKGRRATRAPGADHLCPGRADRQQPVGAAAPVLSRQSGVS